jgi:hypothetical protein
MQNLRRQLGLGLASMEEHELVPTLQELAHQMRADEACPADY